MPPAGRPLANTGLDSATAWSVTVAAPAVGDPVNAGTPANADARPANPAPRLGVRTPRPSLIFSRRAPQAKTGHPSPIRKPGDPVKFSSRIDASIEHGSVTEPVPARPRVVDLALEEIGVSDG